MSAHGLLDRLRRRAVGGYTLVELMVSMVVLSILLGAIGSAVVIASRALPETDDPADDTTLAAAIAADMAAELQLALDFSTRTPEIVVFAVADRDNDSNDELIRYAWSGTPGDPLTRRYNADTPVDALENVQEFALTYETDTVVEVTGVEESAEEMLVGLVTETDGESMPIQAASSGGQFLAPSLPVDAITWKVTRVLVKAEQECTADGELLAQLRPLDVTGVPAPAVLESVAVPESDLPATYNWHEFTFDTVTEWPAVQPLSLVMLRSAGNEAGRIKYSKENGGGRLWMAGGNDPADDKTIRIDASAPPPPPAENHRSIGINAGTLYSLGHATIASGSAIVTFGGGAILPSNVGVGDKITLGGGYETITREESVTATGTSSPVTVAQIQGGANQTYVLVIATRNDADVTSVTGGGLVWTEQVQQCSGARTHGIRIWTAKGSPGAAFQAQITYGPNNPLVAVLARYSGVGTIQDPTGENCNGESGVCTGGIDGKTAQVTLTSTVNGSVHVTGVDCANRTVDSTAPAGYAQVGTAAAGTGGSKTTVFAFDKTFGTASAETFQANISANVDWVAAGIVLSPAPTAETFYVKRRDSDTQVTVHSSASKNHTAAAYTIKRAYNTMQAWENDRNGDLVADDRREIGVCYNDGPFAAGVVIDGSTTDSDHYMKLTVAEGQRHDGTAGTGVRIDAGGGLGDSVIKLSDDYSVLEWLEITNFLDGSGAGVQTWSGREVTIENLVLHNYDTDAGAVQLYHGGVVRNCMFYDGDIAIFLNMSNEGQTGIVENCTAHTWWSGVSSWPGAYAIKIRNTIAVGAGNSDFNLQNDTIDYFGHNMFSTWSNFDPAVYQGNNQSPPANLDDLFVSITPGAEDLHLEDCGHNAIGTGLDLTATFSTDIDGDARSSPWDLGADELIATGLRISSAGNQTFIKNDPKTAISPITVWDADPPVITAVDDIRIRIPTGFNMTWDTLDTVATITGKAAAKVSSIVSYEDAGQTLVLDVTTDFEADDAITISSLSFKNFSDASAADTLELDVGTAATWSYEATESLYYSVYGTYTTPKSEARTYLTGVRVRLRTSSDPSSGVETAAALLQRLDVTP